MPIRLNLLAEAQAVEEQRRKDPVKRAIWAAVLLIAAVLAWASSLQLKAIVSNSALSAIVADMNACTNEYKLVVINLGGAVGLALIDTVIFSRSAIYGAAIEAQLRAGNVATAVGIGIPRDAFLEQLGQPPDEFTEEMVRPLVEKAALVHAINDAWLLIGVATALAVVLLVWVKRASPNPHAGY